MISWQLMNFSRTESKVRFQWRAQIQTQEGPGAKWGLHPALPDASPHPHRSRSPRHFLTHVLLASNNAWYSHRKGGQVPTPASWEALSSAPRWVLFP